MRQVKQHGFTLIELVMVIVILGILAVVAIPKFIDLRSDAVAASTNGMAGALSSASAINYASRNANILKGNAVTDCLNVATSMQSALPASYAITSASAPVNVPTSCTLTNSTVSPAVTATFTALGIL